jgi:hypothetical protein
LAVRNSATGIAALGTSTPGERSKPAIDGPSRCTLPPAVRRL